jgi:tetratricopeptide (TPR) repeat protein
MTTSDPRPAEHLKPPCTAWAGPPTRRQRSFSPTASWASRGLWFVGSWLVSVWFAACASQPPLPAKALELNNLGAQALEQGDLEAASARLSVALEYNPEFVEALTNLGLVEMQRGNFERAEQLFERTLRLNSDIAQAHHALGVLAERTDRHPLAQERYRSALLVDPGFVPARANLGRLLLRSGQANAALLEFQRLLQVAPDAVEGYRGAAESLLFLDRTDEAQELVLKAHTEFPSDPGLNLTRGRLALLRSDFDEARALLVAVAAGRDTFAVEALGWQSVLELLSGQLTQAVETAKQAIALAPEQALPSYALALALDDLGDPQARAWLARALVLDPGNAELQRRASRRGLGPKEPAHRGR